jgi:hypothetical protein
VRGSAIGSGAGVGAWVGSRREAALVLEREESSSVSVSIQNEGRMKGGRNT